MMRTIDKLQLPVSIHEQRKGVERLKIEASKADPHSASESFGYRLEHSVNTLLATGEINNEVRLALSCILDYSEAGNLGLNGNTYCRLITDLRTGGTRDWRGLTTQECLRLLSRAKFIHGLLTKDNLSASQIMRLLLALESGLDVPYKAIKMVAKEFDAEPVITLENFEKDIWERDQQASLENFTDTTALEACSIAGELVNAWTDGDELSTLLTKLVTVDRTSITDSQDFPEWVYLQLLHWCMLPLEMYDHPASYLYEFAPRGKVANSLFQKYHVSTGNPVLNNAKAVSQLDDQWARNRSGQHAHSLVGILRILESLPFQARRSVAAVIRSLLIRLIEISDASPASLNSINSRKQIAALCNFIISDETNTQGVIEQRTVDALTALMFSGDRWKPRGLGDSVNASNLSRRKLGDIEFANIDERKAVAFEAHGGAVTPAYVKSHQQSLERIIRQRLDESWANLDDPENWSIEIYFVSHRRYGDLPIQDLLHEVSVKYFYWSYSELVNAAEPFSNEPLSLSIFEQYFIDALNRPVVPRRIRDVARRILRQE